MAGAADALAAEAVPPSGASGAPPAAAPSVPPMPMEGGVFSWSGYLQALGAVFMLMAALWVAVWLLRRYGRFSFLPRPGSLPPDALVLETQLPLGPRRGLMIVRFMGRRLLLGATEQQITLLCEDYARNDEEQGQSFQRIMEDAARSGDAGGGASRGDGHPPA